MLAPRFLFLLLATATAACGPDISDDKRDPCENGDPLLLFRDADGDGHGDPSSRTRSCDALPGYVVNSDDCDDARADVNPYADERCDHADNDCDGDIDEADDAVDAGFWWPDADADGFGAFSGSVLACDPPEGFVGVSGDCNDADRTRNPDAPERCDGIDNDCDDVTDEDDAVDARTLHPDADTDGYGDPGEGVTTCAPPEGWVEDASDCDDTRANVNPGADELCDGVDDDCDGIVDEDAAADAADWFSDGDGDGWGEPSSARTACVSPDELVAEGGDCDDADPAIHPGATDHLDGVDNDCDGQVDRVTPDAAAARFLGSAPGDLAGNSISAAGDVNADGYADLLVGAPGYEGDRGEACLFLGQPTPVDRALAEADACYRGVAEGDEAGWMVSDAGDVNADGFDDVLVDLPGRAGVGAGWLVLGGTSPVGVEVSASEILYLGMGDCVTCGGEDAAMTLSGAGDVNADGLDDMLFGLPEFEDIGAAFLVLGTNEPESISLAEADAIFTGIARGDHAGCSVSWAGDFDADGQDDMVFGAWGHGREGRLAGAAFLVLGRDEPEDLVFSEADLRVAGIGSSQLGRVVSGAGDVNGDGYADFLVGAPTESTLHPSAGKACLILGRAFPPATVSTTEGACFMEEAAYGYAGAAVSDAGDVNDDGFGDMLVGATYTEDGGSAWLLYGSAEPASLALDDAGAILHGTALTEYRACSVGQAGDFDGDGLPDPLVGGRAYEALTGAAWLFLGFER